MPYFNFHMPDLYRCLRHSSAHKTQECLRHYEQHLRLLQKPKRQGFGGLMDQAFFTISPWRKDVTQDITSSLIWTFHDQQETMAETIITSLVPLLPPIKWPNLCEVAAHYGQQEAFFAIFHLITEPGAQIEALSKGVLAAEAASHYDLANAALPLLRILKEKEMISGALNASLDLKTNSSLLGATRPTRSTDQSSNTLRL